MSKKPSETIFISVMLLILICFLPLASVSASNPSEKNVLILQQDLWNIYKGYIIGGIVLLLFQTALIFTLVINRIKRKRAEKKLMQLNLSLEEMIMQRTQEFQKTNDELHAAKRMLENLYGQLDLTSRTDSMTGLYNRRHMEERLQESYELFLRTEKCFSIMIADIDFFKRVNDQYGHAVGDCLLKIVSKVLRSSVRAYDIVSRWGGEEFLLLLPAVTSEESENLAERIRCKIEEQNYSSCVEELSITITIGITAVRQGDTINALIKRADDAMCQGKHAGRNRVVTG